MTTKSRKPSKAAQARSLWIKSGGDMPLAQVLDAAIRDGIYSEQDVIDRGRRALQGEIRDAINTINPETGVSWGASIVTVEQDDDGEEVVTSSYKQRELWSFEDARYNLQHKVDQLKADHQILVDDVRWSMARFGAKVTKGIAGLGEFMPPAKD